MQQLNPFEKPHFHYDILWGKIILSSCILLLNQTMPTNVIFIFIDTSFSISLSPLILTNPVCSIYKISFCHDFVQNSCVHPLSYQVYQLTYQTIYNLVFPLGSWKVKLSVSNWSLLLVSDMFFQQF